MRVMPQTLLLCPDSEELPALDRDLKEPAASAIKRAALFVHMGSQVVYFWILDIQSESPHHIDFVYPQCRPPCY